MRKFLSIVLSLTMVLTLLPAIHANESHAATSTTSYVTWGDDTTFTAGASHTSQTGGGKLTTTQGSNCSVSAPGIYTGSWTIGGGWKMTFSMTGKQNAALSFNVRGANSSPKNWKVQYCTDTTASTPVWTDLSDVTYTITNTPGSNLKGVFDFGTTLDGCANAGILLAVADGTTIAGATVTSFSSTANSRIGSVTIFADDAATPTPTTTPEGQLDYTGLQAKIDEACELYLATSTSADGTNIAYNAYWANDTAMTAIAEAIEYAELWLTEDPATQQDITDATAELDTALTTFAAARSLGSDYSSVGNIATAKALASGVTTTVKGWVTYRYGNCDAIAYTIIEDNSGTGNTPNGYIINNALADFAIGDYVVLSGTTGTTGGLPQLTSISYSTAITAPVGETAPTVQTYSTWAAAVANAAELYGEYVCINDVVLGTYSATSTIHTSNGEEFTMYSGASYDGALSEDITTVAGDLVNLYGVFSAYNSTPQMRVGSPKNYEPSQTVITYPMSIGAVTNGTLLVEDDNGDEVLDGASVAHGTVLTITATPDANCYLTSLTVNGEGFTSGSTFTVLSATTIAASFAAASTYTVTLKAGTETYDTLTYTDGAPAIDLPEPDAVGEYNFVGWATAIVLNTNTLPTLVADPYIPTGDITLFAVYVKTAATGATNYVLTAANNITAGDYIIGALRSSADTNNFYFLNGTVGSGDLNTNTSTVSIEPDSEGGYATDAVPEGAELFTLAGNKTDGFTIAKSDGTYLGWTSWENRKFAFAASYGETTWTFTDKSNIKTGGVVLSGKNATNSGYNASENSTAQGAVRGYTTNTIGRGIYFFKKSADASVTYTTAPAEFNYPVTLATGEGFTMAAAAGYSTVVDKNDNFHFTFDLEAGYTNSTPVISAGVYTVNRVGETNEYYIEDVTSEVTITVSGVVLNTYTLNVEVVGGDYGTVTALDGEEPIADGATITHGDSLTISVALLDAATQKVVTFKVNNVNKTETATQTVESDVTVEVTFALKEIYTVSFKNRGADYSIPQTIYEGGAATLPTELGAVGEYTFIGWMGEANGYEVDNPVRPTIYTSSYIPAEDTILVAVYTRNVASGTTGWALSDSNFADGGKYIIAGLNEGTYYALKYESAAAASSTGVALDFASIDDTTFAWIAVDQATGTAFSEKDTANYLHLNNSAIRSTTNTTNGIFTFAAGTAENSYIMTRSDGARWLHFEGGNFSVASSADQASDIYFFKYNDGTAAVYTILPTAPASATPVTVGMAARSDRTAIRIAGRLSFSDLLTLSEGDTIDYGFSLNIYDSVNSVPMAGSWATRSAASITPGGFTWTAAMDAATNTAELVAAIRAAGFKVFDYDEKSITFLLVINGLSEDGTGAASCDNLWMFETYTTVNSITRKGAIKYNSANGVLTNTPSGIYVA